MSQSESIIAIDIGNSRIKLARYVLPLSQTAGPKIEDQSILDLNHQQDVQQQIEPFLAHQPKINQCFISSVNQPRLQSILKAFENISPAICCHLVTYQMLSLTINLKQPQQIGIDRLMAAVAANRLRATNQPAVMIDVGTAITIDWVSEKGEFLGGVIMPGITMGAIALHQQTDQLPLVETENFSDSPEILGISTESAIHSGLFYGTVGAMKEVVSQFAAHFNQKPLTIITGGSSANICHLLDSDALLAPHLILDGIAITADAIQ